MSEVEKEIFDRFNPDDLTAWEEHSIQEFVRILIHEMKRENSTIHEYLKALNNTHDRQEDINASDIKITLDSTIDILLSSTRTLARLIDVLNAYALSNLDDKSSTK